MENKLLENEIISCAPYFFYSNDERKENKRLDDKV